MVGGLSSLLLPVFFVMLTQCPCLKRNSLSLSVEAPLGHIAVLGKQMPVVDKTVPITAKGFPFPWLEPL